MIADKICQVSFARLLELKVLQYYRKGSDVHSPVIIIADNGTIPFLEQAVSFDIVSTWHNLNAFVVCI